MKDYLKQQLIKMKYSDYISKKTDNLLPFIIAEIGVNHEGSIEKAKIMIDQAKEGVPMQLNSNPTKQRH